MRYISFILALFVLTGCGTRSEPNRLNDDKKSKESANLKSSIVELKGHTQAVKTAKFSPDGSKVVTTSGDKTIKIWDAKTGKELHSLTADDELAHAAEFSPDGAHILAAMDRRNARIWDTKTGKHIAELKTNDLISSAVYSPDGKTIAISSGWGKTIKFFDSEKKSVTKTVSWDDGFVDSIRYSPDGKSIAVTCNFAGKMILLDSKTYEEQKEIKIESTFVDFNAVFSSDGSKLSLGSPSGKVGIWDSKSGEQLHTINHKSVVYSAGFSPDGKAIVTGMYESVKVWDIESKEIIKQSKVLTSNDPLTIYHSVSFSPDGKKVLVAGSRGKGGMAEIWDLADEDK